MHCRENVWRQHARRISPFRTAATADMVVEGICLSLADPPPYDLEPRPPFQSTRPCAICVRGRRPIIVASSASFCILLHVHVYRRPRHRDILFPPSTTCTTAPTYGPPPARSKFDIRIPREDVIVPDFTTSCCAQISSDVDRSPRATLCSEPGPPRISKLFPFTGVHLVLRGLGWTLTSCWDPIRSSTSAFTERMR